MGRGLQQRWDTLIVQRPFSGDSRTTPTSRVLLSRGSECSATEVPERLARIEERCPALSAWCVQVDESIGDVGAAALAAALSGAAAGQIKTLDLYENHIGDDGARALAGALASAFIKYQWQSERQSEWQSEWHNEWQSQWQSQWQGQWQSQWQSQ